MKVKKISANVRYSKAIRPGTYKTVELSAEASIDPKESWEDAQVELYHALGQQLKTLWVSTSNSQDSEYEQKAA